MALETGTVPLARRSTPALVATAASAALSGIKLLAWQLTGSAAMLASMVDSAADALVSGGNYFVVRAAARPPDPGHPFGHGKLEHLAELFQAILIGGSSVLVARQGIYALQSPAHVARPVAGILTASFSLLCALAVATYLRRAGRRFDSPALLADSKHYTTDYVRDGSVIVAVALDGFVGIPYADAIVSLLIAVLLLKVALGLLWDAAQTLMDRRLSQDEIDAIHQIVLDFKPLVRGYHDLLTRRSGSDRFVQLHVEVDAKLSFRRAHDLVEQIRSEIERQLSNAHVTIHADPWPEDPDELATHQDHAGQSHT